MKLSIKKGCVQISSKNAKLLIGDHISQSLNDFDIVVGNKFENAKEFQGEAITTPGEYEVLGVMIQALPSSNDSQINLISLDIEGVNIVFVRSDVALPTKKMLDQLGINHVLIIKGAQDASKIRDLVDEFGPQFLLPIGSNPNELIGFSKKLGISMPEVQKALSISIEDIQTDEESQILQIVLLE